MSAVRYGTAGWAFADWYGPFYPQPARDEAGPGPLFSGTPAKAPDPDVRLAKQDPLRYYARYFDAVEVNSSFYRVPSPESVARWVHTATQGGEREFWFSFKVPQTATHQGDLSELDAFRAALEPAVAADALTAVLLQFPHGFAATAEHRARLGQIAARLEGLQPVAELRHRSWREGSTAQDLRALGCAWARIDQPQRYDTLDGDVPLTSEALGYVRLHGRNAAAWWNPQAGRDQRFDYLYTPAELGEWARQVEALSALTEKTVVIANNHYRGQAPANAIELRRLRGEEAPAPPTLVTAFPRLGDA
ncbi:MAG: DUF72 domain-containing protein [Planctomycetota bacterium]